MTEIYGLFDTVDHYWCGTDHGPTTFIDPEMAQLAAQYLCAQLGWEETRVKVQPYTAAGQAVDEPPFQHSEETAIGILEGSTDEDKGTTVQGNITISKTPQPYGHSGHVA